nr:hypothetical protein [Tanacetum cinerariifolium]
KTATEVPTKNVATKEVQGPFSTESPESGKSTSFPSMDGSPGGIYQPRWGVTNDCRLDTPDACQDMVDHIVPPGLLKKATTKIAKWDQRIQTREEEIKRLDQEIKSLRVVEAEVHGLRNQTKNLETLLEAKIDIKKATEAKKAELAKELESLRVQFLDLLTTGLNNVSEMDARLDKLSVDFDKELYPHMLTAISGRRWVIGHGLRLAVMKCAESLELRQAFPDVVSAGLVKGMSEGLKHGIDHGKADRDLAAVEAYDPEVDSKYVKALQDLKDLKSNGIPVSVPTIAPRGLAILLADAITQTEMADKEDELH